MQRIGDNGGTLSFDGRPGQVTHSYHRDEVDGVVYEIEYERHVKDDGTILEYLMLWPNDIMFHPPWDSGKYCT